MQSDWQQPNPRLAGSAIIYELSVDNEKLEQQVEQLKQYVLDLRRAARKCGCTLDDNSILTLFPELNPGGANETMLFSSSKRGSSGNSSGRGGSNGSDSDGENVRDTARWAAVREGKGGDQGESSSSGSSNGLAAGPGGGEHIRHASQGSTTNSGADASGSGSSTSSEGTQGARVQLEMDGGLGGSSSSGLQQGPAEDASVQAKLSSTAAESLEMGGS
ncbi:hypothetical protein N2152v2_006555 [Parachlorella kessleri]